MNEIGRASAARLFCHRLVMVFSAFILASCSVPGIRERERVDLGSSALNAFASESGVSPETRSFLRENGRVRFSRHSEATLDLARKEYSESPLLERAVVLAELLADRGGQLASTNPLAAIGCYVGAAEVALPVALNRNSIQLREIYNFCCSRIATLLYENQIDLSQDQVVHGPEKAWVLKRYEPGPGMIPIDAADEVWAANTLKLKGFEPNERIVLKGYGAPMVGHRNGTSERLSESPFLASVGMSLPASVTFDFSDDGRSVEMAIYDGLLRESALLGGQNIPLEVDLTAPLATVASHVPDHQAGFKGMLNPEKGSEEMGLFEIEPHRPNQIPVVFVHGLMSSPGTWTEALNRLREDSALRAKYQLLVFFYPTGYPIPLNAASLRKSLTEYQQFYNTDRKNRNLRNIVIIGHSMGGILSNMQIRESGNSLERQLFTVPISEIKSFTEEQKQMISGAAIYSAIPDITRAVFVASPHRGCELASGWIGQVGNGLIHFKSPFGKVNSGSNFNVGEVTEFGAEILQKPQTSIQELESNSVLLTTILEQPIRPGVVLHSIIGNHNDRLPHSESSDSVVPYWSSHLRDASSEKVVKANHVSITEDAETIEEIRRILYLHAGLGAVPE